MPSPNQLQQQHMPNQHHQHLHTMQSPKTTSSPHSYKPVWQISWAS